ncbi:MAG: pyridoxamine 5'-phosphate oxidase family protein [Nitrospinae bacterium]|nr:pyridoxamine 5'-phosphate oxidase family protein [Nitrospinota bacterium]
MRRSEFEVDATDAQELFSAIEVGQLGFVDGDGWPMTLPVNFAFSGGKIFFHGAVDGAKYHALKNGAKVTFLAYIPYSYIPSYWRSSEFACPATMLFKSVLMKGWGDVITDAEEKALALGLLMAKYQPEGGHAPISAIAPLYAKELSNTAVFRVTPERVDVKQKFAQNLPLEVRNMLIEKLVARNKGMDVKTAEEIRLTTLEKPRGR